MSKLSSSLSPTYWTDLTREIPILNFLSTSSLHQPLGSDRFAFLDDYWGIDSPLEYRDILKSVAFMEEMITGSADILIIGDKDADGMISVAMLMNYFARRGRKNVRYMIPSIEYGLSGAFYEEVLEGDFSYLIVLDMGITFLSKLERIYDQMASVQRTLRSQENSGARKNTEEEKSGILIIDHHQMNAELKMQWQEAIKQRRLFYLHPENREQASVPNTATAGIVFKLLVCSALGQTKEANCYRKWKGVNFLYGKQICIKNFSEELLLEYSETDFEQREREKYLTRSLHGAELTLFEIGRLLLNWSLQYRPQLYQFCLQQAELAGLAILADMMPLYGDNRKIVRLGLLQRISFDTSDSFPIPRKLGRKMHNNGLRNLCARLQVNDLHLNRKDCSWKLIPHINAAGRMGEGERAVQILTDAQVSASIDRLIILNQQRKEKTRANERLLLELLETPDYPFVKKTDWCLCLYHQEIDPGQTGLLANRLAQKFQKLIIIMAPNGAYVKGSVRIGISAAKIDVPRYLGEIADDLLNQYGGHSEAGGFRIAQKHLATFQTRLVSPNQKQHADDSSSVHQITSSEENSPMILLQAAECSTSLFSAWKKLEPFGIGNPEPLICFQSVRLRDVIVFGEGRHWRFRLQKGADGFECIVWHQAEKLQKIFCNFFGGVVKTQRQTHTSKMKRSVGKQNAKSLRIVVPVDISGYPESSVFLGKTQHRIRVEEMRPSIS